MLDERTSNEVLLCELLTLRRRNSELESRLAEYSARTSDFHAKTCEILDNISEAFFFLDENLCYQFLNKTAEHMFGPKNDLIGRCLLDVFPGENKKALRMYHQVLKTWIPMKREIYSPIFDKMLEISTYPAGPGIYVYIRDLTQQRKHVLELQKANFAFVQEAERRELAEKELKIFFRLSEDIFFYRSYDGQILRANSALARTLGYSDEEFFPLVKNQNDNPINIHPDFVLPVRETIDELKLKGGRASFNCRHLCKNGTFKWISWNSVADPIERLIFSVGRDITESMQAQAVLRLSEEKFSKTFHESQAIMAIYSIRDKCFVEVNRKFFEVTGYNREEIIGKSHDLFWVEQSDKENLLKQLYKFGYIENHEYKYKKKSGENGFIIVSVNSLNIEGSDYFIASGIDITELKRYQQEMARFDRLNLIGEMAASIGHEIRNPLTAIRGFLQMIGNKAEYDGDRGFFDLMIEELDRANSIISEYLGMAKNKRVNLQLKALDQIIISLYPIILSNANQNEITVRLEINQTPQALVDEMEIRQLILNMARNSLEAMSAGGVLTLGARLEEGQIVLFIEDEGSGLDPEIQDKLGTPFVTTRDKGTGLGLAVCYSIAARHKAKIDYETGSEGTTFNIRFPIPTER
ncbi:MAG: PAS domain S-box protein [Syntrophomonadaceae bacterium]